MEDCETEEIVRTIPTLSDEEAINIEGNSFGNSFVVRSLNDGFDKSDLSATQKEGLIVCIPKECIKNWRPI